MADISISIDGKSQSIDSELRPTQIFSENSEIFNSDDKASIIKELLVDKIKSDPFSSFNFNFGYLFILYLLKY